MSGISTIQRLTFDVAFKKKIKPSEAEAYVKNLISSSFLPIIEEVIERNDVDGMIVEIDKLEIDLSLLKLSFSDLTPLQLADFKLEIERQIQNAIMRNKEQQTSQIAEPKIVPQSVHFIKILDFYLQYGFFPWWSKIPSRLTFDEFVLQNFAEAKALFPDYLKKIAVDPFSVRRFTNQLKETTLDHIFHELYFNFNSTKAQLFHVLRPIFQAYSLPLSIADVYALMAMYFKTENQQDYQQAELLEMSIAYYALKTSKTEIEVVADLQFANFKLFNDDRLSAALLDIFKAKLKTDAAVIDKAIKKQQQTSEDDRSEIRREIEASDLESYLSLLLIAEYEKVRVDVKDRLKELEEALISNELKSLQEIDPVILIEVLKYFLIYNYFPSWAEHLIQKIENLLNTTAVLDDGFNLFLQIITFLNEKHSQLWMEQTADWIGKPVLLQKILKNYPIELIHQLLDQATKEKASKANFEVFILLLTNGLLSESAIVESIQKYKNIIFNAAIVTEDQARRIVDASLKLRENQPQLSALVLELGIDCIKYHYKNAQLALSDVKLLFEQSFSDHDISSKDIVPDLFYRSILSCYIKFKTKNIDFQEFLSLFAKNMRNDQRISFFADRILKKIVKNVSQLKSETISRLLIIIPEEDLEIEQFLSQSEVKDKGKSLEKQVNTHFETFNREIGKIEERIIQTYVFALKAQLAGLLTKIEQFNQQLTINDTNEFKTHFLHFERILNTLEYVDGDAMATEFKFVSLQNRLQALLGFIRNKEYLTNIDVASVLEFYNELRRILENAQVISGLKQKIVAVYDFENHSYLALSVIKDKIEEIEKIVLSIALGERNLVEKIISIQSRIKNLIQDKSTLLALDTDEMESIHHQVELIIGLSFNLEQTVQQQTNELVGFSEHFQIFSEFIDRVGEALNSLFPSLKGNISIETDFINKQTLKISNILKTVQRIQNKINESVNQDQKLVQQVRNKTEEIIYKLKSLDSSIDLVRENYDLVEIEMSKEQLSQLIKETDLLVKLDHKEKEKVKADLVQKKHQWVTNETPDQKIYIENSGLVLFWLFLPAIFEQLNFVSDDQFVDLEAQEKAVHLLQYIATGKEFAAEHLMPLNKILCGIPVNEPINKNVQLSDAEKAEANSLVESVIKNWPVLKNTSIDGIREAFIQREGVLFYKNGNWNLKVEQKAQDLLLTKLPWGIGTIKLAWTKYIIFVEWR